ncbi:MAG: D-alanyl-D-alanine carboxypeptidase [Cyclobacteriaceae bacterium]|nr:D-alanyl-D-alanine carboxypeptidase [Cyclobacteriaceae bacterium]
MTFKGLCFAGLLGFAVSCAPTRRLVKILKKTESNFKNNTGFALYDPISKKTLVDFNSDRYFTPASNTKIFTFYTSLKLLGDTLPSLKYEQRNDSLLVWGMGDPSFLNPYVFQNKKALNFLKSKKGKIFLSTNNFNAPRFGDGWAWNDYLYSYSPERSPFPLYGNLFTVSKMPSGKLETSPTYFSKQVVRSADMHEQEEIVRAFDSNQLIYYPGKKSIKSWEIPYHVTNEVLAALLSDTLKQKVSVVNIPLSANAILLRSTPSDSLYKVMMEESDNFIAEQLLLQCAAVVSDTLSPEIAIRYAKKILLADLPDKLQWVDGSGLSRFNLFTPRSIVKLWEKIYREVPRERLFQLLAKGGKSGTIKNWYKAKPIFIYGKTGTLSNNHCLSGFLITKSGKTLIFSMMSNNFVASSTELRKQMENIFKMIYEKY